MELSIVAKYSTLFQLLGAALLAYTYVFRRKKDIRSLCFTCIVVEGKPLPNLERILIETWISRFGFCYMVLGYIIQYFDKEISKLHIIKYLNINKTLLFLAFFILLTCTIKISEYIMNKNKSKYSNFSTEDKDIPGYAVIITPDE